MLAYRKRGQMVQRAVLMVNVTDPVKVQNVLASFCFVLGNTLYGTSVIFLNKKLNKISTEQQYLCVSESRSAESFDCSLMYSPSDAFLRDKRIKKDVNR